MSGLVEALGVGVAFGRSTVLDDVDVTLQAGDQLALLGRVTERVSR